MTIRCRAAWLVLFATVFVTCSKDRELTTEDQARRQQLEARFGDRYTFDSEDIYLKAKARNGVPTQDEAAAMVRLFWLDGETQRATSNVTYLNVYDPRGEFAFQAHWDPKAHAVTFSKTEHY